ncbi:hypothetical protein [Streptomyces gobiensis]
MSVDYIAVKSAMTAQQTSSALSLLRQVGCIQQAGFAENGNPVYVLART